MLDDLAVAIQQLHAGDHHEGASGPACSSNRIH
jgi:hypothetical protein